MTDAFHGSSESDEIEGERPMRNHYESSEVLKLGKAHDKVLDQKFVGSLDNFGVPNYENVPTLDEFDERWKYVERIRNAPAPVF